jgi:hypothetical protein
MQRYSHMANMSSIFRINNVKEKGCYSKKRLRFQGIVSFMHNKCKNHNFIYNF